MPKEAPDASHIGVTDAAPASRPGAKGAPSSRVGGECVAPLFPPPPAPGRVGGATLVGPAAPGDKGGACTVTGGDKAGAQVYYVAPLSAPKTSPNDLGAICWHHTTIGVGPSSLQLPIIVFNRGSAALDVSVTRTE